MANIHWDYADAFTGRDAAYLIAGLDPSSGGAEEAYRAQPVIRKLKQAYYRACSNISRELRRDEEYEYDSIEYWSWLIRYRKDCSEIVSIEIETMISNFSGSEFVRKYLPEIALVAEVTLAGYLPFLEYEQVKKQWDLVVNLMQKQFQSDNDVEFIRREKVLTELEFIEKRFRDEEILFEQYWQEKKPLETERDKLWERVEANFKKFNQVEYEQYLELGGKIDELLYGKSNWNDERSTALKKVTEKAWESYRACLAEGEAWLNGESHEFEDQKFSRTELHRWITENGLPSQYQFASLKTGQLSRGNEAIWGGHTTALLEILSKAATKWWANFDPLDPTTAPTNETVIAWLVDEGVSRRIAETMATILRADGLPVGRRS